MKNTIKLFLIITLIFSLAGCSFLSDDQNTDKSTQNTENTISADSRVLIAYFSWAENAILADDVDAIASPSVISPGNVQQLAGWIQEKTNGDLFSIQVTDPYPSDWDDCLARANQERGDDLRPELVANATNLETYDVIFLGYPNWWYGVPMALLTFLENNDLSNKTIYLFCSHGTGGLANSVDIIEEAVPEGNISDNIFDCYEEDAPNSQTEIDNWLAELGY
ncbi:flavodoxin [Thomasclavelia sp.]|uniref:flavodoxin n=1 Tax=Thomasclavelia sp. TaxID=3025757 RepID=UPI0025CDD82E|nr:flavodoxin [Thomasclavelia sp.]